MSVLRGGGAPVHKRIREILCGEASAIPTNIRYDAAVANSVFSYFPNEQYAETVLCRMMEKARHCIGLIDVHDADKKEDFILFRRSMIPDYDERYKGLPKRFYPRSLFLRIAEENGWDIVFEESRVEGYWNNEFVYNVYFYRRSFQ